MELIEGVNDHRDERYLGSRAHFGGTRFPMRIFRMDVVVIPTHRRISRYEKALRQITVELIGQHLLSQMLRLYDHGLE